MSAVMPIMSIYQLPLGQYEYTGHVLLKTFEASGDTIEISACKIKRSKCGEDFNIMMANKTEVNTSPTKIKVDKGTVKVLRVEGKAVVSSGQTLQNVVISDATMANKSCSGTTKLAS